MSAAPTQARSGASGVLVLTNFTLIDGNGGAPRKNAALTARDGRITWVGPAAQLNAPKADTPRDLTGKYVMPGMIDLLVLEADPFIDIANTRKINSVYVAGNKVN